MTSNSPHDFYLHQHFEDALEPYVLGALEEDEQLELEAHLETCFHCSRLLSDLEHVAVGLAQAVPQSASPPLLLVRVMDALEELPEDEPSPPPTEPALADSTPPSHWNLSNYLMPLAAALLVALVSASLIMNVLTNHRLNALQSQPVQLAEQVTRLEQDVSAAGAMLNDLHTLGAKTSHILEHLMATDYLMAQGTTYPFQLLPTSKASNAEGLLLVTRDGYKAVLMLANMEPPSLTNPYYVWVSRNGYRLPLGEIVVDSSGWGAMTINLPQSLYDFDYINLSAQGPADSGGPDGEMVLQTRIVSPP